MKTKYNLYMILLCVLIGAAGCGKPNNDLKTRNMDADPESQQSSKIQ